MVYVLCNLNCFIGSVPGRPRPKRERKSRWGGEEDNDSAQTAPAVVNTETAVTEVVKIIAVPATPVPAPPAVATAPPAKTTNEQQQNDSSDKAEMTEHVEEHVAKPEVMENVVGTNGDERFESRPSEPEPKESENSRHETNYDIEESNESGFDPEMNFSPRDETLQAQSQEPDSPTNSESQTRSNYDETSQQPESLYDHDSLQQPEEESLHFEPQSRPDTDDYSARQGHDEFENEPEEFNHQSEEPPTFRHESSHVSEYSESSAVHSNEIEKSDSPHPQEEPGFEPAQDSDNQLFSDEPFVASQSSPRQADEQNDVTAVKGSSDVNDAEVEPDVE